MHVMLNFYGNAVRTAFKLHPKYSDFVAELSFSYTKVKSLDFVETNRIVVSEDSLLRETKVLTGPAIWRVKVSGKLRSYLES